MTGSNIAIVNCSSNVHSIDQYRLVSKLIGSSVNCKITPWLVKTKYYSVTLSLHVMNEDAFRQCCDDGVPFAAVVLHCDTVDEQRFKACWDYCSTPKLAEIRLLVYDTSEGGSDSALQWCINNNFELIALYPTRDAQLEADNYGEKVGIDRVIEALQSHDWVQAEQKLTSNVDNDYSDLFEKFSNLAAKAKTLNDHDRRELSAKAVKELLSTWNDDDDLYSDSTDDSVN